MNFFIIYHLQYLNWVNPIFFYLIIRIRFFKFFPSYLNYCLFYTLKEEKSIRWLKKVNQRDMHFPPIGVLPLSQEIQPD